MVATAGLMILCQTQNFILFFVALETVALCFYPLVAYNRECAKGLEAGIKYLIFGAFRFWLVLGLGCCYLALKDRAYFELRMDY